MYWFSLSSLVFEDPMDTSSFADWPIDSCLVPPEALVCSAPTTFWTFAPGNTSLVFGGRVLGRPPTEDCGCGSWAFGVRSSHVFLSETFFDVSPFITVFNFANCSATLTSFSSRDPDVATDDNSLEVHVDVPLSSSSWRPSGLPRPIPSLVTGGYHVDWDWIRSYTRIYKIYINICYICANDVKGINTRSFHLFSCFP